MSTLSLTKEWFIEACTHLNISNNIVIAYSGGIDSRVLLDLAAKAFTNSKYKLTAVHINHGLSQHASDWEEHCKESCKALQVPLEIYKVNASPTQGQSPEDAAREARIQIWQEKLGNDASVLLAHHQGDQLETILYRLCRGSGPLGLSGMLPHSKVKDINFFRPLLDLPKELISNYAIDNKISWIEDDSNSNTRYDRNFLRNDIIPLLKSRWPAISNTVSRSGKLCAATQEYIRDIADRKLLEAVGSKENTLSVKYLLSLTDFLCHEVIRRWFFKNDLQAPSLNQLELIRKEVLLARVDASPLLELKEHQIRRYRDDLYLLDKKDINKVTTNKHGKKAKKVFQKEGIPPWERADYLIED